MIPDLYFKGNLSKGYVDDAGIDIILDKDVVFEPLKTTAIELNVTVDIPTNYMGMLIARTSAAIQGLNVAMCPIDAHYNGKITAIVHNISDKKVVYKKGQSFCQLVIVYIVTTFGPPINIRKTGTRTNGKFGSTGR